MDKEEKTKIKIQGGNFNFWSGIFPNLEISLTSFSLKYEILPIFEITTMYMINWV